MKNKIINQPHEICVERAKLITESYQKTKQKLEEFKDDQDKFAFLNSVIIILDGVKHYILRFSDLAKKMASEELDPKRKAELLEISEICYNISHKPPKTFKEALQLILFTHIIAKLEDEGFVISIGRLDQVLYLYYFNDINKGVMKGEESKFIIECFYLKLTTLWINILHKGIIAAEGPPIASNLTIGGIDADGNEVMIPSLNTLGYSLNDAREYAPIGCVEPSHPHKTYGCTNATELNIVKCLELTLNNGTDMFTRKKSGIENSKPITSYKDLWNEFVLHVKHFIKPLVETMNYLDRAIAELNPQPFLSATVDDCIERELDITRGGACYDFTTTQLIGLATVGDSLAVIKKIVFEEKLLSYGELVKMLTKNYRGTYQGKKGEVWRELFINKVPKFGNDDDYVDSIVRDVARVYCEEIIKHKNFRGGIFNPGLYATSFHIAFGVFTAASADRRKSRDVLSNGVGPTNGRDKNGPTAILNSVMKLDNELMTNGNSVILSFHPNSVNPNTFVSLIRTYFKKKEDITFNLTSLEKKYCVMLRRILINIAV
ncbi:MAG: pyruvate formate lyase family protein [Promethearchaeota archaeon]